MVNKINNNEIETTEGVDTENTSYTENEFKEESQKNRRRFLKPIIIGALSTLVVGGAGAYAYDKYETTQKAKIEEAYSKVKMNVGTQTNSENNNNTNESNSNSNVTQQNPQDMKSQEDIRKIISEAISTSEQDINFTKVRPKYKDDHSYKNNGSPLYIYDVEARANGLEYDIKVDAVTGKILKVKIDN